MNEWLFTDPKCHAPLYVVGHCLPDRLCAVGCRPCVLAVPWFRHDSWRLLEPWNLHAKHLPRCSGQPRYLQVCRWLLGRGLPVHQPGFSGLPDRDPRHHALAVAGLRCTFFTIESNTTLLMVQSSHPHTLAECLPSRTLLLAFRSPRRALLVLRAVRTSSLLPMARYVAPFVSPIPLDIGKYSVLIPPAPHQLPFYGSSIATGVPFRGVATPIGFAVSVLCRGDNALLSTFPAVQITASFGADLTEREFTLTRLFYWDAPSRTLLTHLSRRSPLSPCSVSNSCSSLYRVVAP